MDKAPETPIPPAFHPYEEARARSVREFEDLTEPGDPAMVRLAEEARTLCAVRVGMVSLLRDTEEWVLACQGTEAQRIPRAVSFCAHTILEVDVTVVEDTTRDPRFAQNPFVQDEHHMRFYAGAPIFDATGLPLGAVCVCHDEPRALVSRCGSGLRRLAEVASAILESRLLLAQTEPRHAPEDVRDAHRARLDALLLTLVGAHPSGSAT